MPVVVFGRMAGRLKTACRWRISMTVGVRCLKGDKAVFADVPSHVVN
jgi:hypothetical protein